MAVAVVVMVVTPLAFAIGVMVNLLPLTEISSNALLLDDALKVIGSLSMSEALRVNEYSVKSSF